MNRTQKTTGPLSYILEQFWSILLSGTKRARTDANEREPISDKQLSETDHNIDMIIDTIYRRKSAAPRST